MKDFGLVCTAVKVRGKIYRLDGMEPHGRVRSKKGYVKARDIQDTIDGFITTEGDFVDRDEAYDIAVAAGQINHDFKGPINKSYGITHIHVLPIDHPR